MKTIITHISIFSLLFLTQLNLFANEKIKIDHHGTGDESTAVLGETVFTEAEIDLENWMTSFEEFNLGSECIFDKCLQFESWMLDSRSFTGDEDMLAKPNEFENWMFRPFKLQENDIAGFSDVELDFEPWMFKM